MKATKVIMPNGKERILIEVKPKEYNAVEEAFTNAFYNANGPAVKHERRMGAFDNATISNAESFDTFVERKDDQAL